MMKRTKTSLLVSLLFSAVALAQIGDYNTKSEIMGITEQWHSFELPPSVFTKVSDNLADIRIYGITPKDTIEAPYLLRIEREKHIQKEIDFELVNTTNKQQDHYYTFEVPTKETLNGILLNFKNENFDWKVILEGSQEQSNWFTILEDARILAIKNEQTDYRFTQLNFPNAKYRYYRISFHSELTPSFKGANIYLDDRIEAKYNTIHIANLESSQDKDKKQTILQIVLDQRAPISFLSLDIANDFDYYRSFLLQYAHDSVATEKGWKYNYRTLTRGTLNSVEKNEFTFNSVLAKRLRVIIEDHDNQPLNIKNATAKGYVHQIIARFTGKAEYFLVYGNKNAHLPNYDLAHTSKNIPSSLTQVNLGEAIPIPKKQEDKIAPLFENKFWLWAVMGVIILVLGGFTLKMMTKK
ncbi:DUF3999 family protein [Maribacter polysiphoniae]|uniref:DUF3999 family protein n=1 Tax=Maribacter polysiphoniae TaxID=429344 RepID=UPI0023536AA3|nr:DUF3999 family protein [Maribacter polysiphoniae]